MKCIKVQHLSFDPEASLKPVKISLGPKPSENWTPDQSESVVMNQLVCQHSSNLKYLDSDYMMVAISIVEK